MNHDVTSTAKPRPLPPSAPLPPIERRGPAEAPPRLAIILAAGDGARIQSLREGPKPLLEIGGLALLERSLLTLRAAGLSRFRVVVGSRADQLIATIEPRLRARGLAVEWVRCDGYAAGNGASLGCGLEGVDEPAIVAMADHLFSVGYVSDFLAKLSGDRARAHLATDREPARVFDLDDATKVAVADGRVAALSKTLTDYQQIDTGLFYFPTAMVAKLRAAIDAGAASVSQAMTPLIARGDLMATPVVGFWHDVDDDAMARHAERGLLRSLIKPTDGPVSRRLNRPLSLAVSRHLARLHVSPNLVTTFVTLLTLVAAGFAAQPRWGMVAIGGALFHVASILDGCDGEISRLRFTGSRFGAWYDTLSDNVRYLAFYAAIGVGLVRAGHGEPYVWGTALILLLGGAACLAMGRFVIRTQAHLTNLAVTRMFEERSQGDAPLWERAMRPLRVLVKQDSQALGAAVLLAIGLPQVFFWIAVVGTLAIAITVARTLRAAGEPGLATSPAFFGTLAGAVLLGVVLRTMPLAEVSATVAATGPGLFLVLLVPPLWFAANAFGLSALVGPSVRLRDLLYNQIVGDGYNAALPLAGLGGEAFKLADLSRRIGSERATQVAVYDRLMHTVAAPMFTAIALVGVVVLVDLPAAAGGSLALAAGAFAAGSAVLLAVTLSRAPHRLTAALLRRLIGRAAVERPPVGALLGNLSCKLAGRAAAALEVALILWLVGLPVVPGHVVTILAFLSMTSVVFFVVPQGVGVNEAGVAGAFALLGLPVPLGLVFGLIRRARIVAWALIGLALHAGAALIARGFGRVVRAAGRR